MPRNIEIKARIGSVEALLPQVRLIADQGPWEIRQDDTYFACRGGRLKLRTGPENAGELIYYRRDNQGAPKESFYLRSPSSDPASLRELLTQALGQIGRIEKLRTLFLCGRTRIHLDKVTGLGDFLELEVVLAEHESIAQGIAEANALRMQLGVDSSQLIEGSYLDLMATGRAA
jgi:adenylate cyclase